MADQLSNLPVDSSISNHEDIQVVNELFKKHGSSMNHVVQEFKVPLIFTLFFIILSLPLATTGINYLAPSLAKESDNLFMILAKAFIFMILAYFVQNYSNLIVK